MRNEEGGNRGMGWLGRVLLVLVLVGAGWLGWSVVSDPFVDLGLTADYDAQFTRNTTDLVEEVRGVKDWAQVTPEQVENIWRSKQFALHESDLWGDGLDSWRQVFYASAAGELVLLVAFLILWGRRRSSPGTFLLIVGLLTVVAGAGLYLALGAKAEVPGGVDRSMEAIQLPAPDDGEAGANLAEQAPKLRLALQALPRLYRKMSDDRPKAIVYAAAALEGVLALFLLWGLVRLRRASGDQVRRAATA